MEPDRTVACGHDIERLLHRKADGRLSPEETALLERRLAKCAACRERAMLLDWASEALSHSARVPAGLTDGVMRRIAAAGARRAPRAFQQPLATRWLAAAAAVLLAVGVGVAVLRRAPAGAPEAVSGRVVVELQLAGEQARSVAVAGDFNGWEAASMKRDGDGVWKIRLSLTPGRYQYAFLVDQSRWMADPRAATTLDSGFGGSDSVLDLSL